MTMIETLLIIIAVLLFLILLCMVGLGVWLRSTLVDYLESIGEMIGEAIEAGKGR